VPEIHKFTGEVKSHGRDTDPAITAANIPVKVVTGLTERPNS